MKNGKSADPAIVKALALLVVLVVYVLFDHAPNIGDLLEMSRICGKHQLAVATFFSVRDEFCR
jgi:hypothetical protein